MGRRDTSFVRSAGRLAALAGCVALLVPAASASAATLNVTSSADSGAGSLRDQVAAAVDGDTIQIAAGVNPVLTSGHVLVEDDLTIAGQGSRSTTVSAGASSRIFRVGGPGAKLTLEDVTLADGAAPPGGFGGGIDGSATLVLRDVTMINNHAGDGALGSPGAAGGGGGAIGMEGPLKIINSTFVGNSAGDGGNGAGGNDDGGDGGDGGAVILAGDSSLIRNSTFYGNQAGDGGAGVGTGADGEGGNGGAIAAHPSGGTVLLTQSTITGNSAGDGGGVDGQPGHGGGVATPGSGGISVQGSIVAGNTAFGGGFLFPPQGVNCSGVADFGDNISFGAVDQLQDGCAGFTIADPGLAAGPPANNGGPTDTITISPTGPAANAIDPASENCLPDDQRGISRPQAGMCDIGAIELEAPACAAVAASTNEASGVSVNLDCSGPAPLTHSIVSGPANGSLSSLNAGTGSVTYTPATGFTGADSFTYTAANSAGAAPPAQVTISVEADPLIPSNIFRFDAFKPNAKKGTTKVVVEVPGAGALALAGKGLRKVAKQAAAAGKVALKAKPKGKLAKKLKKRGKASAKAKVSYTPTGGTKRTETTKVKFKLKRKR